MPRPKKQEPVQTAKGAPPSGKPACTHRTRRQRELDRAEMVQLIKRGWSLTSIAQKQGLAVSMIHYDYKAVIGEVMGARNRDVEELVNLKLLELEEVMKEAYAAWERSKEDAIRETEEEGNSDMRGGTNKKSVTKEGRLPNPEYLRIVFDCIHRSCQLQALYPAKEFRVQGAVVNWDVLAGGIPDGPVPDAIEAEIQRVMRGEEPTGDGFVKPQRLIAPPKEFIESTTNR